MRAERCSYVLSRSLSGSASRAVICSARCSALVRERPMVVMTLRWPRRSRMSQACPGGRPRELEEPASISTVTTGMGGHFRRAGGGWCSGGAVTSWMTETQAHRAAAQARLSPVARPQRLTRDQITSIVSSMRDLITVLASADSADKADTYRAARPRTDLSSSRAESRSEGKTCADVRKKVSEGGSTP
jgi:hypothetical protein